MGLCFLGSFVLVFIRGGPKRVDVNDCMYILRNNVLVIIQQVHTK